MFIKMLERYGPYVLGSFMPLLVFIWHKRPSDIVNYKEIMGATISVGSIGVGFLAAAITLMPSISERKIMQQFKQIGAFSKLIDYLIAGVIWLFLCSFLSVLGLFLNPVDNSLADVTFLYVWLLIFGISMCVAGRVIFAFIVFLKMVHKLD
ncbi:hypothetical protein [Paenibacillus ehimensis]|uniref:Uncharacterized protein n=1 Tax=Paenibacillus ehimensis TaxID=79264 RepID=A0ABT8V2Z6_9BACL|nr:hypothetical protein [Paenibacillus ehimensis]MDO3675791.1 hypothetical protein [Paenibacillus ehimensis]